MSHARREHSGRCKRLLDQLMAYLDGELTPARCREVERHVAACECCGTMTDNVRAVMALCRSDRPTPVPAALRAGARARIRALLAAASGGAIGSARGPVAKASPASHAAGGASRAVNDLRPPSPRAREARQATTSRRPPRRRG